MFQDNYPVFSRDMILRADMLENMKLYPRDMMNIIYQDYSDGVIAGAHIKVCSGNRICVEPGIVKYHGILYRMAEPVMLDDIEIAKLQIVRIHFLAPDENAGVRKRESKLSICSPEDMMEGDMELCRFQLKDGAVLRQDYQDFKDLATVHNTINLIDVPYAAPIESTVSPIILYYFGKEMLQYSLTDGYDIAFTGLCMQQQPVNRLFIEKYIAHRIENAQRGRFTNEQIHSYLIKVLEAARLGKNSVAGNRGVPRRMLVD